MRVPVRILDWVGLADKSALPAGALPYTDQRRLGIARAMVIPPAFVLLDEPAAGMSDAECEGLMILVSSIPKAFNCGVLLIEHNMRVVMGISHRIHVLDGGKTLAEGVPTEIQSDQAVLAAYLGHGGVMTALLDVENLSVRYGDLVALREASLTVSEGEVVCIIGPNGAGKSTTLATIAGGVTPVSGDIRLDGRTILGQRPEQIARLRLSLVPEGRHIFGTLTVAENLQIGGYMLGDRAAARSDMERLLDHFPRLRERLRYPAGRLSGGEQQMLAVARAVMTRPRLLLVDEPSLGLGPKIIDQIYEILLELRQREKMTLLINEQSSARILKFADRIYVLRSGTVQLEGRAADLRDGEAIRHAYFGFGSGERPVETAA